MMQNKKLLQFLFSILICISSSVFAHEYNPGLHQWKIKDGTIFLVSGLLTNNMALYAHNYNFYIQKEGDKTWHQIPLIDKNKPGAYELNITTKAKDERMVRDARLEIRNKDVCLLRARSERENDFDDSPITVTKYRLIASDDEDWPYRFEQVSSKIYPVVKNTGVDAVLKQEAKQIK